MCCAVVGGDVCEGSAGSGGGALSVSCSGVCGSEHLQVSGDLTGGQTVVGLNLDLELVRATNIEFHVCTHTVTYKHIAKTVSTLFLLPYKVI